MVAKPTANTTASYTVNSYAAELRSNFNLTATNTVTFGGGLQCAAYFCFNYGTGTVTESYAARVSLGSATGGGDVTNGIAYFCEPQMYAGATMTNFYFLQSLNTFTATGGSTTNSYFLSVGSDFVDSTQGILYENFGGADSYILCADKGVIFTGEGSGLAFGEIYAHDNSTATTLAAQSTFYQVTIFTTNGLLNNCVPDHTSDHITVLSAGKYMVTVSMSSSSSQSNLYDFHVKTNNGSVDCVNLTAHRDTTVAGKSGSLSISGICDFAANDTIELWVQRTDGGAVSKTITIEAVTLSLVQIGGT
jgi:hypothetical protein